VRGAGEADGDWDQLKGHFLASLNHELRTPLSGVIGMTDLLLETPLDGEQREYLDTVRQCATQLLETLNSVLEYSALSAGNVRTAEAEFSVAALLAGLSADYGPRASARGLSFECDSSGVAADLLEGDERYLRQVLDHLARNAVKFTQTGGVRVAARLEPLAAGTGRLTPGGAWLRIEVRDTGIGIPEAKLRMIFDSFRQVENGLARSFSGLGLGLALVQRIVMVLRGEITVHSRPGGGSTFAVRVPVRVAQEPDGAHEAAVAASGQGRVLVVEDNHIAQRVVGRVLERAGYSVALASSGRQGVEMAARERFDLVLMDLQMPGMDGLAATRAIRSLRVQQGTPVLALTANTTDADRSACREAGMQGFLSKPVHKEQLLAMVASVLGHRRVPVPTECADRQ
jgi:CheY-like chemotaxis protein